MAPCGAIPRHGTVDRTVVLTGGWQTSKETAYVEATRARHRTDWFIARDDLGSEGQDPQRITRLAQRMTQSRARTPSLAYGEAAHDLDRGWELSRDPLRLEDFAPTRLLARTLKRDTQARDAGRQR